MLGSRYSQPISGLVALVATGIAGYGVYSVVQRRRLKSNEGTLSPFQSPALTPNPTQGTSTSLLPFLLADNPLTIVNNPVLQHIQPFGLPALPLTTASIPFSNTSFPLTPAAYSYPLFVRDTYVCAYNPRTRNPDWVLEYIGDSTLIKYTESAQFEEIEEDSPNREKSSFRSEPFVLPPFRVYPTAYLGTGYDRGHLVPAANARSTQHAMNDTFYISNISPQSPPLNRIYWQSLESFTRSLGSQFHDVFVVTGPLFMPNDVLESAPLPATNEKPKNVPVATIVDEKNVTNPTNTVTLPNSTEPEIAVPRRALMHVDVITSSTPPVLVPTHFFKVIVALNPKTKKENAKESESDTALVASFALPNNSIKCTIPLTRFALPVQTIENYSGYRFFPLIPRQGNRSVAKSHTESNPKQIETRDLCTQVDCDLRKFHEKGRKWLEGKKSSKNNQSNRD